MQDALNTATLDVKPAELLDQSLGGLISCFPGATLVFRRHRIGFCCHPDQTLQEAAKRKELDPHAIAGELCKLPKGPLTMPDVGDVDGFIDFILTRYHDVHREELIELIALSREIEIVHGDHPDAPVGLADALMEMAEQLDMHMTKEENILFPAMREMSRNTSITSALAMPIHCMREEPDDHGQAIHKLQKLTNNCTLPDGVCGSWRRLYSAIGKLIEDLVAHMYLENSIRFPRFE